MKYNFNNEKKFMLTKLTSIVVLVLFISSCAVPKLPDNIANENTEVQFSSDKNLVITIGYQDPGLWNPYMTQEELYLNDIGNPQSRITKLLDMKNVDVESMFKDQLISIVEKKFKIIKTPANLTLNLDVIYGFYKYLPTKRSVRPMVFFSPKLIDAEGNEIWVGLTRGGAYNGNLPNMSLEKWLESDKSTLTQVFEISSKEALEQLVELL